MATSKKHSYDTIMFFAFLHNRDDLGLRGGFPFQILLGRRKGQVANEEKAFFWIQMKKKASLGPNKEEGFF